MNEMNITLEKRTTRRKKERKKGKRERVGNTYAVKEALLSVWQMATLFKREYVTGLKVTSLTSLIECSTLF
jgi:hypothetical protein